MTDCLTCGSMAVDNRQDNASRAIYSCPNCGTYVVSDIAEAEVKRYSNEVAAFLVARNLTDSSGTVLISFEKAKKDKEYIQLTVDQIVSRFPKDFTEAMEMSLLNLIALSTYGGEEIMIKKLDKAPLFYVRRRNFEALSFMIKSMHKADLVEVNYYESAFFPCGVVVSPKGWDLAKKIRDGGSRKKGGAAFLVLPRREEEARSAALWTAARKSLEDCGMKWVENSAIAPGREVGAALAAEVRQSNLVICDLSEGTEEVYFALGMAVALRKPVIITCHRDEKKNMRLNPGQFPVVLWEGNKDLYLELYNSIRAMDI